MNKAEKRVAEVKAVSIIYGSAVSQAEWIEGRIDGLKKCIESELELNANANTEFYERDIEELTVELKAYEKIAEHLLKLMQHKGGLCPLERNRKNESI